MMNVVCQVRMYDTSELCTYVICVSCVKPLYVATLLLCWRVRELVFAVQFLTAIPSEWAGYCMSHVIGFTINLFVQIFV